MHLYKTSTIVSLLAIFTFSLFSCAEGGPPSEQRPNVIIIFVDDLARGDVGAFGCPDSVTPNIDALANAGIKCTNAYTINTPCSPSRTGLMMGMYTQRFGKYDLSRGVPIPDDKPTMAETMRDAGYVTGFVGTEKWDIGSWNQGILDRGFQEAGCHPPRVEGREYIGGGSSYIGVDGSYLTEVEGSYCVEFIEKHAREKKPFFLYFVPLAVHIPNTEVPQKYLDRAYPDHKGGRYAPRQYLRASLLALDDQVGKIREKLRETKVEHNTLIMFASDNGGDPAVNHRPDPYRGGKRAENMQWEGNFRMPIFFTFPGTLPAGKEYDGMVSTLDFYATAAAVAKTKLPKDCEGKNLIPYFLGEKKQNPEDALFWHTHRVQAARWQEWRIVKYGNEKDWRLYQIEKDPAEKTDLAKKHPEILKTIEAKYDAWLSEMPAQRKHITPPKDVLPHTVGGTHARRPFGRGWMTVEQWDKIKDDPTQWSEKDMRLKVLKSLEKAAK